MTDLLALTHPQNGGCCFRRHDRRWRQGVVAFEDFVQGGGALGAYQAGVYQALQEAGIEPDWVIGTSIGAINASLIAGNPPEMRLKRLREFWDCVRHNPFAQMLGTAPFLGPWAANALKISVGVRGFFEPNPWAFAEVLLGQNSPAITQRVRSDARSRN
jgi:hypothetical protein